uniref:Frizzled-10 n=1 Tax=Hofstenia miamia TaxID=442651 RepID=A0A068CRJ5_HOFMI|nr:frizzled-10 [Hofstenia miamia]
MAVGGIALITQSLLIWQAFSSHYRPPGPTRCETINMKNFSCTDVLPTVNYWYLPNSFGLDNVTNLEFEVNYFKEVLALFKAINDKYYHQCYEAFKVLLCVAYFPPCATQDLDPKVKIRRLADPLNSFQIGNTVFWRILPCKELCQAVEDYCWDRFIEKKSPWYYTRFKPCSQFPEGKQTCIGIPSNIKF